jgi:hypothetical protein
VIRRLLFLVVAVILFLAVVGFLAYRPATVTGVKADSLASSVDGAARGSANPSCVAGSHGRWKCGPYRVHEQGSFGCWRAKRTSGKGSRHLSGCITILDYL